MSEHLMIMCGGALMVGGVGFIAWQTVILARMLADITALVARTLYTVAGADPPREGDDDAQGNPPARL